MNVSRFNYVLKELDVMDFAKEGTESIECALKFLETNGAYFNPSNHDAIYTLLNKIKTINSLENPFKNRAASILKRIFSMRWIENHTGPSALGRRSKQVYEKSNRSSGQVRKKSKFELSEGEIRLLNQVISRLREHSDSKARELVPVLERALTQENLLWRKCEVEGGYTILHLLDCFDLQTTKEIVDSAGDLDVFAGTEKKTPLIASFRNPEIVRLLLAKGADPRLENSFGENFVYLALCNGSPDVFSVWRSSGVSSEIQWKTENSALCRACGIGNLQVVRRLHEAGVDLNGSNSEGQNPLSYAAYHQKVDVIDFLLESGVDLNHSVSFSIFLDCIYNNRTLSIEKFHKKGIDLNVIQKEGGCVLAVMEASPWIFSEHVPEFRNIFIEWGLEEQVQKQIINTKYLANVWGIGSGLSFHRRNTEIEYDGFYPRVAASFLARRFAEFLPTLQTAYPDYLTEEVARHLSTWNRGVERNGNLCEVSNEDILALSLDNPQFVLAASPGHTTSYILWKERVVKCDRMLDLVSRVNTSIKIYRRKHPITSEMMGRMRDNHASRDFFVKGVDDLLGLELEEEILMKPQSCGNCSWASPKAALFGVLFLLAKEHSNRSIAENSRRISKSIYKSFTSFVRFRELENFLQAIEKEDDIDWLLLSLIRIKIETKLKRNDLTGFQRDHFLGALELFQKYLTDRMLTPTVKNKKEIIHYFIAERNFKAIRALLASGVMPDTMHGGMTPLKTARKTGNRMIIDFLNSEEEKMAI